MSVIRVHCLQLSGQHEMSRNTHQRGDGDGGGGRGCGGRGCGVCVIENFYC